MRKGVKSTDGKFRASFMVPFRIGAEEIAGCVEYAFSHGGMGYDGDPLRVAIEEFLSFNSKNEIEEAVKKVLTDEGYSYDSQNWDNDLENSDREQFEAIVLHRFKRELDL